MLKKTITYEDFNEETQTEEFYFHLSVAELTAMELEQKGGLAEALKRIIAAEDGKGIVEIFQDIILRSYGQKSDDGRRFIKTQELRDEFTQTGAYSVLFLELVTNAGAAVEFIRGLMPKDMIKKVDEALANPGANKPALSVIEQEENLRTMTAEELAALGDQDKAQAYMDIAAGRLRLVEKVQEEIRIITQAELVGMSSDEYAKARYDISDGKATLKPDEPFTS